MFRVKSKRSSGLWSSDVASAEHFKKKIKHTEEWDNSCSASSGTSYFLEFKPVGSPSQDDIWHNTQQPQRSKTDLPVFKLRTAIDLLLTKTTLQIMPGLSTWYDVSWSRNPKHSSRGDRHLNWSLDELRLKCQHQCNMSMYSDWRICDNFPRKQIQLQ